MDISDSMPAEVICSYCLQKKPVGEMSDEHIWPASLGGDPLGFPWRTDKVCRRCNSICGQWVDGAFIKSWFGSNERYTGVEDYLDPADPDKAVVSAAYLGTFEHEELLEDEIAEFWVGLAGEHMLHIRPRQEEVWDGYAGGKPTRKRSNGGHAYMAFTSAEPFWARLALRTFQRQFRFATRTLANSACPDLTPALTPVDPADESQARHLRILKSAQGGLNMRITTTVDFSNRFLAKLALGLGRETFGDAFLFTPYAQYLAHALREADFQKRQAIPVRGSGFFSASSEQFDILPIKWPGAWILMTLRISDQSILAVVTPSGKVMTVQVSDDPALADPSGLWSDAGTVWLAIPAAGEATGPISMGDYLAFVTGAFPHAELTRLKALRSISCQLPPKHTALENIDDSTS
ncbi:HNH endonuclease [Brevundimonas sp.]|uniref:HNH endonuclease n=1 Tax=Brevundimonas sp. TaxID=1871086 RepID=UPI002899C470|nr:HNH endonuclease [Brevundimonas sp.]